MFQVLESNNHIFTLSKRILELAQKQKLITNKVIKQMRTQFRDEAFLELTTYEQKKAQYVDPSDIKTYEEGSKQHKAAQNLQRLRFLNKFIMMTSQNKLTSIVNQSTQDPQAFFHCDPERWPICLFDFTYKNVLPQYFLYGPSDFTLYEGHFYGLKE